MGIRMKWNEDGQAGVVGILLVILIIMTIFSIWYVTLIPEWKREEEAKAASNTLAKFGELRSNLNLLTLKATPGFSLTTTLRLSGSDLPIVPDAVRQSELSVNPSEGNITVTRYWGDGDPVYQKGGSFEVATENEYYTNNGTVGGNPDWYPQRCVIELSAFDVEFHDETEPKFFDLEEEESVSGGDRDLVKNVKTIVTFDIRFTKLKKLEITVKNGVYWKGKFWRRNDDLRASIVAYDNAAEAFTIGGYFDDTSENYRKTLNLLEDRYHLKESIKEGVYNVKRKTNGDLDWWYHIVGYHAPVQVETDFKPILEDDGNKLWEAHIKMKEDDLEIKIYVRGNDMGTRIIGGYFDPTSENHWRTIDLLEDEYFIGDAVSNVDNYDVRFSHGDKAYGSYRLTGVAEGGMMGVTKSESWLHNLGTVNFNSKNNYYVDQIYSLEDGGVIIEQENAAIMIMSPQIKASVENDDTIISIHSFDLLGVEHSLGGSGSIQVELWFVSKNTSYKSKESNSTTVLIEVKSDRVEAWKSYFSEILTEAGLKEGVSFILDDVSSNHLNVVIVGAGSGADVRLANLSSIELGVRIR